ncbi:MAG: DsrE family protein [Tissierellia bacterium]|nr:DsrE family protein [Tissierellia bacterium]
MKKVLVYAMEGKKMCFLHALMNAKQLKEKGYEVKVILEGQSVTLPKELVAEKNPLFQGLKEDGTIVGVCHACSKTLGVFEDNEKLGLTMIDDMYGHAGVAKYLEDGYEVLTF